MRNAKEKIVETETFSVDERIRIISGIIGIMEKRRKRVPEEGLLMYFHAKSPYYQQLRT